MKRPVFTAANPLSSTETETEGIAGMNAMCMTGSGGKKKAGTHIKALTN